MYVEDTTFLLQKYNQYSIYKIKFKKSTISPIPITACISSTPTSDPIIGYDLFSPAVWGYIGVGTGRTGARLGVSRVLTGSGSRVLTSIGGF